MTARQKVVALVFGAALTLVGLVGFSGVLVRDGHVIGVFGITPLHSAVHLLTGAVGLLAGYYAGGEYGERYNRYLGAVYVLVFVVGAVAAGVGVVVELLNLGWADNALHLVVGVVLAAVGFGLGTD